VTNERMSVSDGSSAVERSMAKVMTDATLELQSVVEVVEIADG